MTVYIKDPDAVVDYTIDWNDGYLETGETITSSQWSIEPTETDGLSEDASSNDNTTASITLSGGVTHHTYRVTNRITTTGGRTDERSLTIRVAER